MNNPVPDHLLRLAEPFAGYRDNQAARLDVAAEARAQEGGARVGISRPHESAALHVAGSAAYIDDLPELAGTLHAALGLSPVAHGTLRGIDLDALRAQPGVRAVKVAISRPWAN